MAAVPAPASRAVHEDHPDREPAEEAVPGLVREDARLPDDIVQGEEAALDGLPDGHVPPELEEGELLRGVVGEDGVNKIKYNEGEEIERLDDNF